jgi:type IV pilus biogenesis protein CpaD/CtpE
MTANNVFIALLGSSVLALAGCAVEPEKTATETHFGESVRQMVQAQTANPSTLSNPPTESLENADGKRLEKVLEAYRTDVAKPEAVKNDVVISVDNARR